MGTCTSQNSAIADPVAKTEGDLFATPKQSLCVFHFNDVYEIEDNARKEVAKGVPRFITCLEKLRAQSQAHKKRSKCEHDDVTVFAGDLFAPSKMAQHFKGAQMIAPFNACKVDVAMIGNHDLDFGVVQM
jgi:2',3'-cyclic-nucleotide 2'-phosphodiesterase (5'-nucleotidase family)